MRVLTSKSPPPHKRLAGHPLMPRSAQVDDMRHSTANNADYSDRVGHGHAEQAAVNDPLSGRGARSKATDSGTALPVSSADELPLVPFSVYSCLTSQTPKPGVLHVKLTERAANRGTTVGGTLDKCPKGCRTAPFQPVSCLARALVEDSVGWDCAGRSTIGYGRHRCGLVARDQENV